MDTNSLMFLLLMMVAGVLITTLFYWGGHFVLRLLEMPARARVAGYGLAAVDTDSSPGAPTLNHVGAADPQPGALSV